MIETMSLGMSLGMSRGTSFGTSRGMNLYYRGYVIHEDIRALYYTIYGTRPDRQELAGASTSREAMEWVDRRIAEQGPPSLMVWPSLFSRTPLSAMSGR